MPQTEADEYELTVVYKRLHSEDDEVVKDKFPGKPLTEKLRLQLAEELQAAADCGNCAIAGSFEVLPAGAEGPPQPADPWEDHPQFPSHEWRLRAYDGDTRLGYRDWVASQLEQAGGES